MSDNGDYSAISQPDLFGVTSCPVVSIPDLPVIPTPVGGWRPMDTFPDDGNVFDVLCESANGVLIIVKDIHLGRIMGKDRILRGSQNILSPYLTPKGWCSALERTAL